MSKLTAFRELTRLQYVPFALMGIYSGYLLADNLNLIQLFFSSIFFVFLYVYLSSDNFYNDMEYDQVSVRTQNPILNGDITVNEAQITRKLGAGIAIMTSYFAGLYWMLSVLIGIGMVILYQSKPFRLKHTPIGTFLIAFQSSIPFMFAYFNGINGFTLGLPIILITIFLHVNTTTALYHIADMEGDAQMNSNNFTVQYGVNATRALELLLTIASLTLAIVTIMLNYASLIVIPILIGTTFVKVRIIAQPLEVLKDPHTWGKYAPAMVLNIIALFAGIVVTTMFNF
jgi:4-hydroxybenzoate polyprenyltransferase